MWVGSRCFGTQHPVSTEDDQRSEDVRWVLLSSLWLQVEGLEF